MRILFMAIALLAVVPLSIVHAQDCSNATTQTAMSLCADQAYKHADAELNVVYKQITVRLQADQDTTKLLVSAQKNWIAFRDAECTFSTSASAGGSASPMLVSQCRDRLTHMRANDLKTYLHCQEGDMGCPVPSS